MKRSVVKWFIVLMASYVFIDLLWTFVEIKLYGFSQESIADFAVSVFMAHKFADWITKG